MTRLALLFAVLSLIAFVPGNVAAAEGNGRSPFEASVVTIDVTFKDYDFFQPWTKPTRSLRKHALVAEGHELVTTAQHLADRTLVRAQKYGRGRWFNAEVRWIDYHANVAVMTVADEAFWEGLKPVTLATVVPRRADYEIIRWRDGNLETRRADFSKFTVAEGALSFAPRMNLELSTELGGLGWAEPVAVDGQVVGLTVAKGGSVCTVMPAPFLGRILDAWRQGKFPGLGYFDFVWQQGENPATLEFLKLRGEPRGAVVIDIPERPAGESLLKKRDVILEVDGFPVDMQGDYEDPDYGHLMIEGLATRRHFAGDRIPLKVLRDGAVIDIPYVLPKTEYGVDLLPMHAFDREPEYLISGGLVFQPLHQAYLRSWGDDWRRRAPFRLGYFTRQSATSALPSLVVLSQVLPDPFNVGYQEYRSIVVSTVNGRKIVRLADLKAALREPKDGMHLIEYMRGDSVQRMLLDADGLPAATARVLERYGIPSAELIESTPPS